MNLQANCSTPFFKPINTELNPTCHLLASLDAHHILHISRIRANPIKTTRRTVCMNTYTCTVYSIQYMCLCVFIHAM